MKWYFYRIITLLVARRLRDLTPDHPLFPHKLILALFLLRLVQAIWLGYMAFLLVFAYIGAEYLWGEEWAVIALAGVLFFAGYLFVQGKLSEGWWRIGAGALILLSLVAVIGMAWWRIPLWLSLSVMLLLLAMMPLRKWASRLHEEYELSERKDNDKTTQR